MENSPQLVHFRFEQYISSVMGELIPIHQKRLFSIEEARDLLPVVRRITREAHDKVAALQVQASYLSDERRLSQIQDQVLELVVGWMLRVRRLGCEPKEGWLVDFDCGDGYYCWHYPEPTVNHFHGYSEGFNGRVEIS